MKEQTVWITGASSGIGWALAQAYNRAGAFVIISARRISLLQDLRKSLSYPDQCLILPLDLEQHHQSEQWVKDALQGTGNIDVLINNGGIGHLGSVQNMELEIEKKVMDINLWGAVALTKAVLPHMLSNNTGQIWTVASILGYFGSPRLAAYAASKFGVVGYFESLQYEMKNTDIHIGILSPGFINTHVTLSSLGPQGQPIGKNSTAQESGMDPKELARVFLKKSTRKHPPKQVFIGGYETFSVLLKRFIPSLFFFIYGKLTDITRKKKS